jgi:hypothetical protein
MALLTNINGKFSVSDAGAVTFNNAFTFPTADGAANYVLQTNGSGQLAWALNGNGDISGSGTANTVTKFTGAKTVGNGPVTFSGNNSTFAGDITIGPKSNASITTSESGGATTKLMSASVGRSGTFSNHEYHLMQNSAVAVTIDVNKNVTFEAPVWIPDYIYHVGDPDTYFGFSAANEFLLVAGGSNKFAADVNAAYMYYQGGVKLQTTSTGVTVNSTVSATSFLGDLNGTINTVTTATTKGNSTNDTTVATTAFVQNVVGTIPAGLVFQGTWNASTNSPTLTSGSGTTGHFYIVSVAGSTNLDGITDWQVGDWAVFIEQGASDQWEKIDNSSVLGGSGTGGSFAGWLGSGTSVTLGNAPVTFSGNNSAFIGHIAVEDGNNFYGANAIAASSEDGNYVASFGKSTSGSAKFAGNITVGAGNSTFAGTVRTNGYLQVVNPSAEIWIGDSLSGTDGGFIKWNSTHDYLYIGNSYSSAYNENIKIDNTGVVTLSDSAQYHKIQTFYSGSYTSGFKFSDYNGGIWYDAGSDDLTLNAGHANSQMLLNSGGAIALTLDASQNATFAGTIVSDNIAVGLSDGNNSSISLTANTGNWTFTNVQASRNLEISDSDGTGTVMTINTSGNIGIGTTSPANKLTVSASNTGTQITTTPVGKFINTGNSFSKLIVGSDNSNFDAVLSMDNNSTLANTKLRIYIGNGTNATTGHSNDHIVLQGNGNVGIGTNSPSSKLQVSGDAYVTEEFGQGVAIANKVTTYGAEFRSSGASAQVFFGRSGNDIGSGAIGADSSYVFRVWKPTDFSQPFVIEQGGNVGIGTTSPDSKLDVKGPSATPADGNQTLSITNSTGGTQLNLGTAENSYGWIEAREGSTLRNLLINPNGGNVGIGVTDPDAKLEIKGTGASTGLTFKTTDSSDNEIFYIKDGGVVGVRYYPFKIGVPSGTANVANTRFQIATTGGDFVVLNDGKTGIGTTSPAYKLQVQDANAAIVYVKSTTNNQNASIWFNSNSGGTQADRWEIGTNISAGADLEFFDRLNSVSRMVIQNDGKVGIGTISPLSTLDLGINGGQKFYVYANGSIRSGMGIDLSGSSRELSIFHTSSNNIDGDISLGLRNETSGQYVERMRVQGNGNVGIGTTGPVNKLGIQVAANSNTKAINIYSLNTSPNSYTSIGSQYSISNTYVESEIRFGNETQSGGGSYLGFVAGGSNSGNTEKMRITSAGNVGIGETSPAGKLHVKDGSVNALFVTSTTCGNVGIKTTSPNASLVVKGNVSYGYNNYSSVANTWSNALNFSGYPAGLYQINICKQSNASAYIIAQVKWSGTAGTVINTVTSFQYGITFSGTQLQSIINTTTASSISAQCLVTYELACV